VYEDSFETITRGREPVKSGSRIETGYCSGQRGNGRSDDVRRGAFGEQFINASVVHSPSTDLDPVRDLPGSHAQSKCLLPRNDPALCGGELHG
jgi:hypothetical protein